MAAAGSIQIIQRSFESEEFFRKCISTELTYKIHKLKVTIFTTLLALSVTCCLGIQELVSQKQWSPIEIGGFSLAASLVLLGVSYTEVQYNSYRKLLNRAEKIDEYATFLFSEGGGADRIEEIEGNLRSQYIIGWEDRLVISLLRGITKATQKVKRAPLEIVNDLPLTDISDQIYFSAVELAGFLRSRRGMLFTIFDNYQKKMNLTESWVEGCIPLLEQNPPGKIPINPFELGNIIIRLYQ